MNRPELYQKTVDILYNAYFSDTLEHGNCTACAVGNIIAANMGFKYFKDPQAYKGRTFVQDWVKGHPYWRNAFLTIKGTQRISMTTYFFCSDVSKQIDATGYPIDELAKIEFAFETAPQGDNKEDYMFNGLVAVLDVLKQIHEVDDNTSETDRFQQNYITRKQKHEQTGAL